jgi:hypothetical protein
MSASVPTSVGDSTDKRFRWPQSESTRATNVPSRCTVAVLHLPGRSNVTNIERHGCHDTATPPPPSFCERGLFRLLLERRSFVCRQSSERVNNAVDRVVVSPAVRHVTKLRRAECSADAMSS